MSPHQLSELRTTNVDLSGLLTVLGQHLYSTPAVALRELVQNAHDSITRRLVEDEGWSGGSIRVEFDTATNSVMISDEGAGLTHNEIHKFLATIGTGYTRLLRERSNDERLIGLFGLGFLSAFVLAERVSVVTTSYQTPGECWRYRSSGGERYAVEPADPKPIGTTVILELRPKFRGLLDVNSLTTVLARYCSLLAQPVYVCGASEAVNAVPPPWRQISSAVAEHPIRARKRKLEFAERFETRFAPICTMDIDAGEGRDAVAGLLWVQDGASYATSDNRNLSVFVRGMLLDDDARDLLPLWAGFIGGVIESNTLTPTASREDLQRDEHYQAVKPALHEAVIAGLSQLPREQPEAWRRILLRHNEALLAAALCDERLFNLLANSLHVPTSQGDLDARGLISHGRIHVAIAKGGFEDMLFRAQQIPVALGDRYAVLPFLRRWCEKHSVRLVEIGTERGDHQLFKPSDLAPRVKAWLCEQLLDKDEELAPVSFSPDSLPFVLVPDREAELKRRLEADDADKRISTAALRLARLHTQTVDGAVLARLYLNTDCKVVKALAVHVQAAEGSAAHLERAKAVARILKAFKIAMASENNPVTRDLGEAFAGMASAVELLLTT
jgi:molecular chaperone HtpG